MKDLQVEVDGLQLVLNSEFNGRQSSVQEYVDCHRKYGWRRIENLEPDKPSWALEFGSATHIFLMEQKRGTPLAESIDKGLVRLTSKFPKSMFPGDDELLYEHREMAKNMWPAYTAYYADEDDMTPLGLEIKGRVEVGQGTNVFLVFTIDSLAKQLDQFWIVDHKTMAKNDDRNFEKHAFSMQLTAYTYGASKVLGARIAGAMINGLIKTKSPQFRREFYMRTDAELLEFENEFPEIVREIAWRHARVAAGEDWKTVFYKNTDQCMSYYKCPFFDLCGHDSEMNRTMFKKREPDYMDDPNILLNPPKEQADASTEVRVGDPTPGHAPGEGTLAEGAGMQPGDGGEPVAD